MYGASSKADPFSPPRFIIHRNTLQAYGDLLMIVISDETSCQVESREM